MQCVCVCVCVCICLFVCLCLSSLKTRFIGDEFGSDLIGWRCRFACVGGCADWRKGWKDGQSRGRVRRTRKGKLSEVLGVDVQRGMDSAQSQIEEAIGDGAKVMRDDVRTVIDSKSKNEEDKASPTGDKSTTWLSIEMSHQTGSPSRNVEKVQYYRWKNISWRSERDKLHRLRLCAAYRDVPWYFVIASLSNCSQLILLSLLFFVRAW